MSHAVRGGLSSAVSESVRLPPMKVRSRRKAFIWLATCGICAVVASEFLYQMNSSEELSFINSVNYSLSQHPEFIPDIKVKPVRGWQDIDEITSAQIVKRMIEENAVEAGPLLRWRLNSKLRKGKLGTLLTIQVSVDEDGKRSIRVITPSS